VKSLFYKETRICCRDEARMALAALKMTSFTHDPVWFSYELPKIRGLQMLPDFWLDVFCLEAVYETDYF
jgi:hypothetical protein